MKEKFQKLKKSKRLQNIAKVSSGTLAGQLINIFSVPFFTRIYGAEILGVWAFLNAIFLVVNSFSDLGLKQVIMIGEKTDDEYNQLVYKVISSIALVISIVSTVIILFFFLLINSSEAGLNLLFLSVYSFLAIFTLQQIQICNAWINRRANYNVLMKNPLINNFSFAFFGIVLGLLGFVSYGYFIGWLIGQLITLSHIKKHSPKGLLTFKISDFQNVIQKNLVFIKYQLPSNVLIQIKGQIPTFFIQTFFGIVYLGYFSITLKMLKVPVNLLGNAVGRIFFQEASDLSSKGKAIGMYTYNNMKTMMKFSLIPMILFVSLGSNLLVVILGEDWRTAGEMFTIISFQSYFRLLMMSVSGITALLQKQHFRMVMSISQIISICLAFTMANFIFDDIFAALIILTIGEIIINIVFFCKMFIEIDVPYYKYLQDVLINFLIIITASIVIRYLISSI